MGLGAWALGGTSWSEAPSDPEAVALVDHALSCGITFFDTAPTYGASETIIGRALSSRRDEVRIATKVGPRDDPRASLTKSLGSLRTDHVDLLQLHEPGPRFEWSMEVLGDLRREGGARRIGLCNATATQIRRAHEIASLDSYQGPYNLIDRSVELRELPTCRELGIPFIAYRPLASGLLGGMYQAGLPEFSEGDHRHRIYWFKGPELARRRQVVEGLKPLAEGAGLSLAVLVLAWARARPGVGVVLAGGRTQAQVADNAAAAAVVVGEPLISQIDEIVARVYRAPSRSEGALAEDWGERERFIIGLLDGRTSLDEIAARWSDENDVPMIGAQVRVFVDQLVERGLAHR